MSGYFIVWLTTAGAFGFTAKNEIGPACDYAAMHKQAQVFRLEDSGFRYSIGCAPATPYCGFPGWVTVPITCVWEPEKKVTQPARWEEQK